MSRDPFDRMRNRNPVPPEDEPAAPMALAERIIGRRARAARRPLPGFALAAVSALVVLIGGGAMLLLTRPSEAPPVGAGDPTTTTAAPTTTAALAVVEVEAPVYFLVDQAGDGWVGGPFLIPVATTVAVPDPMVEPEASLIATVGLALERLFEGVEDADADPAMSSAIPVDAEFLGVVRYHAQSEIVTVEVSSGFASGGGSFSMMARLAQVVYTATAVDGVSGVRFEVDGEPTTVFGGEGVIVDDPATRDGFEDLLPAILIESPPHLGTAGHPLVAAGKARVFEATVSISLHDADGNLRWEGFTTATDWLDGHGDWEVVIDHDITEPQWATLTVWEASAEDGRSLNVRSHQVYLVPERVTDGS